MGEEPQRAKSRDSTSEERAETSTCGDNKYLINSGVYILFVFVTGVSSCVTGVSVGQTERPVVRQVQRLQALVLHQFQLCSNCQTCETGVNTCHTRRVYIGIYAAINKHKLFASICTLDHLISGPDDTPMGQLLCLFRLMRP